MRITEISIKNFRPEIGAAAVVEPGEDPDEVFTELLSMLKGELSELVDDELEQAGRSPRYATDLYTVQYSDLRQCVVVARVGIELPVESNWKSREEWNRISYDLPLKMRIGTAKKALIDFSKDYRFCFIHEPAQLADLPPLPDPGPEPLWYVKQLRPGLNRLRIPDSAWESVASLDHVNETYLSNFGDWYNRSPRYLTTERMVEMLIAGETPWANAAATPTPDDSDEEE